MEKIEFPEIDEADLLGSAVTEADLFAAAATEADLFADSTKEKEAMNQKILSPLKSIRAKCLECSNGSFNEVKLCPIVDCALYFWRFGKNPNRKLNLSPEKRKALSDRMKKTQLNQSSLASTIETETI